MTMAEALKMVLLENSMMEDLDVPVPSVREATNPEVVKIIQSLITMAQSDGGLKGTHLLIIFAAGVDTGRKLTQQALQPDSQTTKRIIYDA